MMSLDFLAAWVTSARSRARGSDRERGDVPGWVMVTVMSAILVVAILAVFEPQIKDAIGNALDSVTSSK
ncbi:MAG: hypothetical protein QOF87_2177 [Pseudonocardiales bacterium]|jgi:predicted Co/Zn/Cd cation transporter (cation efflux family)|nr:uncharacterized protein [Pseudonocardiales bacterium]MDT4957959.1 hypothetical protein [Pseudonocardiales bacterium]MDT4962530.1 hypothetical protein [Pseudonocardiales bacterium]MDT4971317.1 hypothetical protein [Pseudonocardiales bacterium]MDT4980518.1 hypothetical protein [Pseudonocardiales bacterium]